MLSNVDGVPLNIEDVHGMIIDVHGVIMNVCDNINAVPVNTSSTASRPEGCAHRMCCAYFPMADRTSCPPRGAEQCPLQ